jgi:hypothetical protein
MGPSTAKGGPGQIDDLPEHPLVEVRPPMTIAKADADFVFGQVRSAGVSVRPRLWGREMIER